NMADKYGFQSAVSSVYEVLGDPDCNTVFVATRHNTHFEYVMAALKAGKNVFVEKPLCLTRDELDEIAQEMKNAPGRLMVGFNRRFSEATEAITAQLKPDRPMTISYQINAGA